MPNKKKIKVIYRAPDRSGHAKMNNGDIRESLIQAQVIMTVNDMALSALIQHLLVILNDVSPQRVDLLLEAARRTTSQCVATRGGQLEALAQAKILTILERTLS
jgi:hypothetical protein